MIHTVNLRCCIRMFVFYTFPQTSLALVFNLNTCSIDQILYVAQIIKLSCTSAWSYS